MKSKQFWLFVTAILVFSFSFSQNVKRRYLSHKQAPGLLEIETNDGTYLIKPYSEKIMEVSFIPGGEAFDKKSHAVNMTPIGQVYELNEYSTYMEYETGGVSVTVIKRPFQISFTYKGKQLVSEGLGYKRTSKNHILDFNIDDTEKLYGGGARALGMDRRGNRLELYNKAHYGYEKKAELMNFCMPLVFSSKMYAIHFDNPTIGFLDFDSKKNNHLAYETQSGRKTYQIIVGDTWTDLIENYTLLTGRQPLPPRWMFGNFASRFGYHSDKEVREVVSAFKTQNIPLDAVVLDLYWFGKDIKGTMGNLEFDKQAFPDHKNMISSLESQGIKTILITEPFILTTSSKWKEAVTKNILATNSKKEPYTYDFYFGNTGLIDVFKPEAKTWFWSVYKKYIDVGIGGWWGDLGEPEVHPSDMIHATGTADQVHNIYGHEWAKMVYEGYKKDYPGVRPFILMRAGYSGSQRYGMIPWSGDVNRTWGGLQSQPEIALQMGMQGMGYMHSDLGGFAGANLDDELYTRWLQYGVYQPIFRPHAQEEVPSEPVFREDKTKQLAKEAIEQRYKMLPYNYTLAYKNHTKGTPLMRPLFFNEPENKDLLAYSDAYLWGDNFLVAPILEAAKDEIEIYFPKNTNWYDITNDKVVYQGGFKQKVPVAVNKIPVFIKGGTFLPETKAMQNTNDYDTKDMVIHYYFDRGIDRSSDIMYHDDGKNPDAITKGEYEIIHFDSELKEGFIDVYIRSELGSKYEGMERNLTILFHGFPSKPLNIKLNGDNYSKKWDKKKRQLTIECTLVKAEEVHARIHLLEGFLNESVQEQRARKKGGKGPDRSGLQDINPVPEENKSE